MTVNAVNLPEVSPFVDKVKEIVPYEVWMGVGIIFVLLYVLAKVPLIGPVAKVFIYLICAGVALVVALSLGLL